jgi:hypothetical protein
MTAIYRPIELDGLSIELRLRDEAEVWRRIFNAVRGRRAPKRLPTRIAFAVDADQRAMHVDVAATRLPGQAIDWILYLHFQDSVTKPDRLSRRLGYAAGLGAWIDDLQPQTGAITLSCSATFECDRRRTKVAIIFPDLVPKEFRPPEGLAQARVYSIGLEQGQQRISIEIDRAGEKVLLGVAFQIEMTSLKGLLSVIEEEAWRQARSLVQEVPNGVGSQGP